LGTLRKVGGGILIGVGIWIIFLATIMNWGDLIQFGGTRAIGFVLNLLVGIFSVEIGILGIKGWNHGGIFAILMGAMEIMTVMVLNYVPMGIELYFYGLPALGIELLVMGLKWEMVVLIIGGIFVLVDSNKS